MFLAIAAVACTASNAEVSFALVPVTASVAVIAAVIVVAAVVVVASADEKQRKMKGKKVRKHLSDLRICVKIFFSFIRCAK